VHPLRKIPRRSGSWFWSGEGNQIAVARLCGTPRSGGGIGCVRRDLMAAQVRRAAVGAAAMPRCWCLDIDGGRVDVAAPGVERKQWFVRGAHCVWLVRCVQDEIAGWDKTLRWRCDPFGGAGDDEVELDRRMVVQRVEGMGRHQGETDAAGRGGEGRAWADQLGEGDAGGEVWGVVAGSVVVVPGKRVAQLGECAGDGVRPGGRERGGEQRAVVVESSGGEVLAWDGGSGGVRELVDCIANRG